MRCNYRCPYCYSNPLWKYYINTPLPKIEKIDKILSNLPIDITSKRIISILGGEPTLLPKSYINEICHMVLSHNNVRSYIATNLYKPEVLSDIPDTIGVTVTCHPPLLQMNIDEIKNKLSLLKNKIYLTYILLPIGDNQFAKLLNIYLQNTEYVDSIEVEFLHGKMELDNVTDVLNYKNFLIHNIERVHHLFQEFAKKNSLPIYNPPPPISPHLDAESVDLLILTPDLKFTISSPNMYNILEMDSIQFFDTYDEAISTINDMLIRLNNRGIDCINCPYFFKCTSVHKDIPIKNYHQCVLYQIFTKIRSNDNL